MPQQLELAVPAHDVTDEVLERGKLCSGHMLAHISTLTADADGLVVVPLCMGTNSPFGTTAPDGAILADVVVVADTCPAALEVPSVDVLDRCVACLGMVQDDLGRTVAVRPVAVAL